MTPVISSLAFRAGFDLFMSNPRDGVKLVLAIFRGLFLGSFLPPCCLASRLVSRPGHLLATPTGFEMGAFQHSGILNHIGQNLAPRQPIMLLLLHSAGAASAKISLRRVGRATSQRWGQSRIQLWPTCLTHPFLSPCRPSTKLEVFS